MQRTFATTIGDWHFWEGTQFMCSYEPANMKLFYNCGICDCYHPAEWNGDCRDDANRFAMDELDAAHGPFGWEEIPMPGSEESQPDE